jgi:hypothetical protein
VTRPRDDEQRDARAPRDEPEGEWVNGEYHNAKCRCRHCDPDRYNDEQRFDLGKTYALGRWW